MISLLRQPDAVYGATDNSDFRFEENRTNDVRYDYVVEGNSAKVVVYPSGSPVKYLKLRFRGDLQDVDKVMGDQWERAGHGLPSTYIEWRAVMPFRPLPWFCYLISDGKMDCYGVKTGADAFVFFQVDQDGITLFINLCSGSVGADLQSPLTVCEVVELHAEQGADYYKTAQAFAKRMCDKPVLPKTPVFGVNNWYWAYGNISHEVVAREAKQAAKLAKGCQHQPYVIIDDGWQINREDLNNKLGQMGPWIPNSRFPDMKETVAEIHRQGAKAGLWIRPLLTTQRPDDMEMVLVEENEQYVLDPSHPKTLAYVEETARRIAQEWGFDLIKHDFTVIETTGYNNLAAETYDHMLCRENRSFYDKTKSTATVLKNLYKAIQRGAGDKDVIGCGTIGHLTAGVHSIYRTGADTSGRCYEWTHRDGGNCLMRLPLNNAFYLCDPDCSPFTDMVDFQINLEFLEMSALTGQTVLASIKPGLLTEEQLAAIREIFLLADSAPTPYGIDKFDKSSCPECFISADGTQKKRYHWGAPYDGSRVALTWYK